MGDKNPRTEINVICKINVIHQHKFSFASPHRRFDNENISCSFVCMNLLSFSRTDLQLKIACV